MRDIRTHVVNGLNEHLQVQAHDDPGPGNANHFYKIVGYGGDSDCEIHFQNGPIKTAGVNGISNEALLAVIEDRLKGFQSGSFACRENALALTHLQEAIHWLNHRTRERMQRGVEGTMEK